MHGTKLNMVAKKGKLKGQEVIHFCCGYCKDKYFQGPSSSAFLDHLRKAHPEKCVELLPKVMHQKPKRDFFEKSKKNLPFDMNVFSGKLLKLLIQKDLPFSLVDADQFKDLMQYLKKDLSIHSRKTIMRRLEELYLTQRSELKDKLNSFKSKYSLTCDVWTSKNQLSFFLHPNSQLMSAQPYTLQSL